MNTARKIGIRKIAGQDNKLIKNRLSTALEELSFVDSREQSSEIGKRLRH